MAENNEGNTNYNTNCDPNNVEDYLSRFASTLFTTNNNVTTNGGNNNITTNNFNAGSISNFKFNLYFSV